MGNPPVWFAVMFLLLPGLVLLLANVAILLWAKYPRRSVQVLAAFLLHSSLAGLHIGSFDGLGIGAIYAASRYRPADRALRQPRASPILLLFFTFLDLVESTNLVQSLNHLRP